MTFQLTLEIYLIFQPFHTETACQNLISSQHVPPKIFLLTISFYSEMCHMQVKWDSNYFTVF